MPIRPENKARYPKNWKEIRASILERAQHKCEECGVANYAIGIRQKDGSFYQPEGMESEALSLDGERFTKIVLTISHTDHTPENNDPANLRALCQRCHLRHDIAIHVRNRPYFARLRKEKAGQQVLFKEQSK